jgi:hypothetical protein
MKAQNQIKRNLLQPSRIEYIRELLGCKQIRHRTELAEIVCEQFGFYDPRGQPQLSGCLKALRELEAAEHFILPTAKLKTGQKSPRRLSEPVELPTGIPEEVSELSGLTLILVETTSQMRLWNEMMLSEHPLGAGPLVGRQLRYLIGSEHGWLGGFGFAAPALQLTDRDRWIGWDTEERRKYLHTVVGMSRFLIRPSVKCRNLASKVLSMSMSVLADDFERKYKYRPLLVESFVDTKKYSGVCYRASNWIPVGKTKGRGRQDRFTKANLSFKTIYMFPLESDFRERMELSPAVGQGALEPGEGLEADKWAEREFGGAPLGDIRLSKRLVKVAAAKAEEPGRAFSGVAKGDWASVKAYYRLIDQPEESAINISNILLPHRGRTIRRMQGQKTVLCIQDGSDLNYTNLAQCKGLGVLGKNQTGAKSRGLHLHTTLAVAPNGLPLGVLRIQCPAPGEKSLQEDRPVTAIPIEEKKTFCWIEHHRDLVELSVNTPHTRLIDICDREADIFELFDEQRQNSRVDLLIRARYNRNITEEPFKLFTAVGQEPVQSRVRINIPRQSTRPKQSKQKSRPKRPGRIVNLQVRYKHLQIRPARYHGDKAPIDICVIHALEENPSPSTRTVEWYLLTTIKITSPADAEQCLRWYCLRWRIEDWHRVLKSGCRIEDIAHKTSERLRRAIAINCVIAWRIMLMTLLGRETPELPAETMFSDIELRTLRAYAKKKFEAPLTSGRSSHTCCKNRRLS